MMKNDLLTIAVITYRRLESLRHTLMSLNTLQLPENLEVEIVVIDNDPEASAKDVVTSLNAKIPITYVQERERGIPAARNKALHYAKNSQYLAFIDDDDVAAPQWLCSLYNQLIASDADIVRGIVSYIFPKEKKYLRLLEIFLPPRANSGDSIQSAATNNVLFKTEIYKRHHLLFDPEFTLTGGSDYLFFKQAITSGCSGVMCREAIVYSIIPEERLTLRWLMRRYIRVGAAAEIAHRKLNLPRDERMKLFFASLQAVVTRMGVHIRKIFSKQPVAIHLLLLLCKALGSIIGLFGLCPKEYR